MADPSRVRRAAFEDFFDAFSRCAVTRLAREHGEYSTERPERWLKAAAAARSTPPVVAGESPLPLALRLLLELQAEDGRWTHAASVKRIVGVSSAPRHQERETDTHSQSEALEQSTGEGDSRSSSSSRGESSDEQPADAELESENHWKWITALAIAFIRQHIEHFDHTIDAHDKAAKWMTISDLRLMRDAQAAVSDRAHVSEWELQEMIEERKQEERAQGEAHLELTLQSELPPEPTSTAPKAVYVARRWGDTPATVADELLAALMAYERHIGRIRRIVDDGVRRWGTAKLLDERYKAFDPLTAVFNTFHDNDDGNGNGNGNGELCHISQLCRVCEIYAEWQQRVREESVRREEKGLVTAATTQRIFQTPKFVFDGRDVLAYLMQSLDFLSERRELVEWYGGDFPLQDNPFMVACGTRALFVVFEKAGDELLDSVMLKPWHKLSDMIRELRTDTRIYWPQYPPCEDEDVMKKLVAALQVLRDGLNQK